MPYTPYVVPGSTGLSPNAYGNVGGGTLSQGVVTQYDLYKPNELTQVFERHNYSPSFRLMLKNMGFTRGTQAPTTGHYEYEWKKNLVTFGAVITPSTGPGTTVVYQLDPADMFDAGVTVNGVSRQASYPLEKEIIRFPDGNSAMIVQKDTTTTPHILTLTPLDQSMDLQNSIDLNEGYFISTNAHGEGSGLPKSRTPRIIEYSNTFQIVKTSAATTGSALTDRMYFNPVPGREGSLYMKVKEDAMYRFECMCDGALMWGNQINNITEFNQELGYDVAISGTEGFIPFSETNGNQAVYTAGSYQTANFDDLAFYYELERVDVKEMIELMGIRIHQETENVLADIINGDNAIMVTNQLTERFFYGDGGMCLPDGHDPLMPAEFAIRFNFKAIQKSGFNFFFFKNHVFNERVGAGASAYNFVNWKITFPVGFTKNKTTGEDTPTVGYEYKQQDGYSREMIVGQFGGAGTDGYSQITTNQYDIHRDYMISELAFHATCGNHVTLTTPV